MTGVFLPENSIDHHLDPPDGEQSQARLDPARLELASHSN